ncbi:hypothetical protein HGRIS_012711 [Hohenbuehelia grisea]|uniref:SH3 domain-containing protein n=1 Tax=Hohenbuehelia grisea TaxID=104357 RepID=A0ABR3IT81_9AGAR
MSSYFQKRLPAGQAQHHAKRQLVVNGITVTAPITITQTVVVPARSSASSSIQASLPTSSSIPSLSNIATPSQAATSSSSPVSPSSTSSLSSPTSTLTSVSSTVAPMETERPASLDNNRSLEPSGAASKEEGIPAGAVAGIVLAIVLVLLALLVFFLRKRLIRHRQQRSSAWKDNIFSKRPDDLRTDGQRMERGEAGGNFSASTTFAPAMVSKVPVSRVPVPSAAIPAVPSMSYNNPPTAGFQGERTPGFPTPFASTPVRGTPTTPFNGAAVVSTFIPTLPDELSISLGDTVRVLAEYDDGWALCASMIGEKGMVPLECLDLGNGTQPVYVSREGHMSRRASSLAAHRR